MAAEYRRRASLAPTSLSPDFRARSNSQRSLRRESIFRIEGIPGHHGNRIYNLIMDFVICMVMLIEIAVVVYLSISHFLHQSDLMAIAMLLPILLNFIGATYYLSSPSERKELEEIGSSKWATDLLQFPVLGPIFMALKVLRISCACSPMADSKYERIEASSIKMRQANGFFSAAPESLVQLTVLLTIDPQKSIYEYSVDGYLEIFVVALLTVTLAESNCYNTFSNYYKMFTDHEEAKGEWRLSVKWWQKVLLFLHAVTSIGSRMLSSACLKAAALYVWGDTYSFPLVLTMTIFAEIAVRLLIYYTGRTLGFCVLGETIPSSCYESINYAWRASILDYAFQSKNVYVQVGFYIQNLVCFGFWNGVVIAGFGENWVKNELLLPVSLLFTCLVVLSIGLLITAHHMNQIQLTTQTVKVPAAKLHQIPFFVPRKSIIVI